MTAGCDYLIEHIPWLVFPFEISDSASYDLYHPCVFHTCTGNKLYFVRVRLGWCSVWWRWQQMIQQTGGSWPLPLASLTIRTSYLLVGARTSSSKSNTDTLFIQPNMPWSASILIWHIHCQFATTCLHWKCSTFHNYLLHSITALFLKHLIQSWLFRWLVWSQDFKFLGFENTHNTSNTWDLIANKMVQPQYLQKHHSKILIELGYSAAIRFVVFNLEWD